MCDKLLNKEILKNPVIFYKKLNSVNHLKDANKYKYTFKAINESNKILYYNKNDEVKINIYRNERINSKLYNT